MSIAHLIYVPISLLVGLAIGYVLGARAGRAESAELAKRAKQ
jgi:hypothetical protein